MQSLVHCTMGKRSPPAPPPPPLPSIRHLKVLAQKAMTVVCSVILWKHAASGQICGSRVETGNKDEKWFLSIKEAITRRVPTPSGEVDSLISPKQF